MLERSEKKNISKYNEINMIIINWFLVFFLMFARFRDAILACTAVLTHFVVSCFGSLSLLLLMLFFFCAILCLWANDWRKNQKPPSLITCMQIHTYIAFVWRAFSVHILVVLFCLCIYVDVCVYVFSKPKQNSKRNTEELWESVAIYLYFCDTANRKPNNFVEPSTLRKPHFQMLALSV